MLFIPLALLACSQDTLLARVPSATRLGELANGELIVGTTTGALWRVTSFGETEHVATLPGGRIEDIVTDPVGRYWVRTDDGTLFGGGIWNTPTKVATDVALVVRDCEETLFLRSADLAAGTTARSLGEACGSFDNGDTDGRINGVQVTTGRLTRVQRAFGGVLWVDDAGTCGCLDCDARAERVGVKDAIALHLAPFVPGELAWIDDDGGLWTGQD